jgi:hypothetical protein
MPTPKAALDREVCHQHNQRSVSITLVAHPARSLLVATADGELGLGELQEFLRTARAGERRDWLLLFDATSATTAISADQVRALSMLVGSMLRVEGPRAPVAMVAAEDALFGVMRMYQTLCEAEGFDGISVFRARETAETWLMQRAGS